MTQRESFVWPRRIFWALTATVGSIVIGLDSVGHPLVKPAPVPVSSLTQQEKDIALNSLNLKAIVGERVKTFEQEIAKLAQQVTTFSVPKEFEGKTVFDVKLLPQQKVIALTFDDGPWSRSTKQILEILKQNHIEATFFWIGQNVKNFPAISQQVVSDGHAIGNHTWHHWYRRMDSTTAVQEINNTANLIYETTGVRTFLFRPPGGFLDNGPAEYARQKNDAIIMWSDDSRDWSKRTSLAQLINNVLNEAHSGGIVLMHDGGGDRSKTVKALPTIIATLRQRGYKFVTVPELLAIKDKIRLAKPAPSLTIFTSHHPQ